MQNVEDEDVPSINTLVVNRARELILKNRVARIQRCQDLDSKYRKERESIKDLCKSLVAFNKNINDLCKRMLSMTFDLNAKSAAVIGAILNNMFAEKAAVDKLYFSMKKIYYNVEKDFKKCQFLLNLQIHDIAKPREVAEAESMLKHLHDDVILINEMASYFYEKGYEFLCVLERVRKKIEEVVKRTKL